MAIQTEHPEYTKHKPQWDKLRDVVEGQEKIHKAGVAYLPKLSDQDKTEYDAYKARALFYGATGRTVDGLSGMVFRKDPKIVTPDAMKDMIADVTLSGIDLVGFSEELVDDAITVGRSGILVDHPAVLGEDVTVAQAEVSNIRPFMKHYTAEQIFNWKTESRNNAQVTTQVRLWEWVEKEGKDEFDVTVVQQIRILDFNEVGQYRQRVFVQNKNKEWIQEGDDIIPTRKGVALDVIPFFFVGVKNSSSTVEKPPLIDMANVNISHYMSTADLEHGAHFTGLPTAVITGHSGGDEGDTAEYRIGAATAWVFPDPETKAFFLEFQGKGLDTLEKRIEKKEEYMAFLGALMLMSDKAGVESTETTQLRHLGETSVLSSLAKSVEESIEQALIFMADWAGISGDISFKLNNDFLAITMSAQELTAILAVWQAGGMAFSDLFANLKRGEIIAENREEDEVLSEVEQESGFKESDLADDQI